VRQLWIDAGKAARLRVIGARYICWATKQSGPQRRIGCPRSVNAPRRLGCRRGYVNSAQAHYVTQKGTTRFFPYTKIARRQR